MSVSIVWFRSDLRLSDNPALIKALEAGRTVVPVFVLDEGTKGLRRLGAASRWWLHYSLHALDASLRRLGSRLVLRRGPAEKVIAELAVECRAESVFWNRVYDQGSRERDARLKKSLSDSGIAVESCKANLLFEPWEVTTQGGDAFKVFTPFWRACRALPPPAASPSAPTSMPPPPSWPAGEALASWGLLPSAPDWAAGLRAAWTPGEDGARQRLAHFLDEALGDYREARDLPAVKGTSRLSPHLAFGEISPRQVWHAATARGASAATDKFLSEVGWREFAYHLIFHNGDLAERNFRREFDAFPWADQTEALTAWQRGRTGYPIVDAGMRELWTTGWMHNRVRMIAASFLTKDLLIDWRRGERWFWDTLVDADVANNATGWQWVAGCGADAAPYFRVFNPVLQGEKFDPDGDYVRRWVPELAHLPSNTIHRPWEAAVPASVYPARIVEHGAARDRALAAFQTIKKSA
ncbi:deoxyribodipyrimidine photo-lyase [Reyranella sp.]|jgi:deoxyribodipyrimidine photo-lyase|uniref:cryptochrome/photolyase family protein n=1 Tax=Reyranella sp. TaxID=1929291 RepID=UPI000BDB5E1F|nr:deoxyribodipyrimidine photo-lyase [Reyranella sp.]OYY43783.1 MAG: deoxyribodipyrimidine photolyase [Rhodospirillales bacterium 35-66-84]OYZ94611.1 MAG: deoxyribodipyrimidine photolyase [Rhodospirillales bacterium 24-66-33]OZB25493.1 MAG: deoxyribodipyrimidine photolyase [Rhodospirillales bacterium 39-66-50]HQS16652.1 deoxyribodipyrimidine photo-lyase [Reyranella sp.]HQT13600.1 deoxyribodipyrimidine photo-lyase [Reyranella sp.]